MAGRMSFRRKMSGGLTTTLIYAGGSFYGTGQYGGGFNWGAIFQMTLPH